MKQNKNTSAIRFLSFLTAIIVLSASISFLVFADSCSAPAVELPVSTSNMSNQQIFEGGVYLWQYSTLYQDSVMLRDHRNNEDYDPVGYVALYWVDSSHIRTVIVCPNVETGYYAQYLLYNNTYTATQFSVSSPVSSIMSSYTGDYLFYERTFNATESDLTNMGDVPVYSSREDALNACISAIDNPSSGAASPAVAQFVLPAGNAVAIDLGGWDNANPDKKISLSQSTQYAHPQVWSTNQFYAYTDTLPASISTPFSGQSAINWYGNGKSNLFNQTTSFGANFIYNSSLGRYLIIINPFVPEDHDTDNYNSPISVYVGQCSGYKFYQLKTDVSQIGAFGGQGDGTTGTGVYDPDSGTWTVTNDQTGDVWAPTQGGGNSNNVVSTVSGWLEQISHQISDFFSGAIGAVTNLVSAGSDFIHSLSGLYAWLPAPVYSVLVSALILVITIGVIKVFI